MSDRLNPTDAVDEIYTNPAPIVDFVKMQIGFWEKMVVLDAATLAASFTASGIFREHLIGDGGVGYLAAAWKLLFCGLALCLIAQWIAISGVIASSGYLDGMRVLLLLNKSTVEVPTQGGRTSPAAQTISSEIIARSPKLLSDAKAYARVSSALGSLGLVASLVAFYWLYRFLQVNGGGVGH
jgi:hypothetical protein